MRFRKRKTTKKQNRKDAKAQRVTKESYLATMLGRRSLKRIWEPVMVLSFSFLICMIIGAASGILDKTIPTRVSIVSNEALQPFILNAKNLQGRSLDLDVNILKFSYSIAGLDKEQFFRELIDRATTEGWELDTRSNHSLKLFRESAESWNTDQIFFQFDPESEVVEVEYWMGS